MKTIFEVFKIVFNRVKITLMTSITIVAIAVGLFYLNQIFKYETPRRCSPEDCIEECYCDGPFSAIAFEYGFYMLPFSLIAIPFAVLVDYRRNRRI